MRPDRAYEGLMLARRKLFDWVKLLNQEQYTKHMPTGLHTLRATMVEMCRGEWIYSLRLRGETPPPRDQWPISEDKQPTFADLERVWTDQAKRTHAQLASTSDWSRPVEYRVQQPGKIIHYSTTAGDLVTQLLFHEVHHRAQAMAMLRSLGVEAQNLDYSLHMFTRREESA
ncbi:MAG: DinB family protein [bacterium]